MRHSPHNEQVLEMVRESIAAFATGDLDLRQVQSILSSVEGLLENDRTNAASLIRNVEGDLEEIRFATPVEEQRELATARLDRLRAELALEGRP